MAQQMEKVKSPRAHMPRELDDQEQYESPAKKAKPKQFKDREKKVQDWWGQVKQAQAESRYQRAIDEDYVDGKQWSDEDRHEIEVERGQPAITYNMTAPTVRWITGTEKRSRVDFYVLPRGKADQKAAEDKTKLLKYVSDVNKSPFHVSQAFEDATVSGLGWLEEGVRQDPIAEPLMVRYEHWRNIWHDHLGRDLDGGDWRFIFRSKHVDLDVAQAYFPKFKNLLKEASENQSSLYNYEEDDLYNPELYGIPGESRSVSVADDAWNVDSVRQRVQLVECWYREPMQVEIVKGQGGFNGAVFRADDPLLAYLRDSGEVEINQAVKMVMRLQIFAGETAMIDELSPYWHNRFPFTPLWGYRFKRDGMPYGIVRNLRDPQDDLNKRYSKAQHILATKQVIMDDGAVDDINELAEEVARPDGIIVKKAGKELQIHQETAVAAQHVDLMRMDQDYIQRASGVTDENLGRQTNAVSGKAIKARQDQGVTSSTNLFDNLRLAMQMSGEKQLALIEQFYDEAKSIRITETTGMANPEFHEINTTGDMITDSQADFKVDETSYFDTVRQAFFETMMDLVTKLPPEIGVKMLDIVIDMSDVPMRDEIVRRIREITGMKDPEVQPSPEEIAAEQAAQQKEAENMQREQEAMLSKLEGEAKQAQAKGDQDEADVLNKKIEVLKKAMEVAEGVYLTPELGEATDAIVDDIKEEAGQQPQLPGGQP